MSCDHDCRRPLRFPKRIENRPGLATIDYRIGSYADMREHMLALLDANGTLSGWTHRLPDDPGIALIEAASEVGDILSLYQDLYANEAYLRTAKWRDSVADLVRLLGYRLAPGLGGRARFAFAVTGSRPVVVPKGFGIKAQIEGEGKPAVFETVRELAAVPALSQFRLYRPRLTPPVRRGTDTFTLVAPASASVALKAGDRIMVGIPRSGGAGFDHTQILVVDTVTASFGATVVTMKGGVESLKATRLKASVAFSPRLAAAAAKSVSAVPAIAQALPLNFALVSGVQTLGPLFLYQPALLAAGLGLATVSSVDRLRAWKLGASARHFGHNAPSQKIVVDAKGRAQSVDVSHLRSLAQSTGDPAAPAIGRLQVPLEGEVSTVVAGTTVLVEANLESAAGARRKRLLERTVAQVDRQSLAWGSVAGASTVLTLDEDLAINDAGMVLDRADIRGVTIHQVDGPAFALQAMFRPVAAATGAELDFYGVRADAEALAKRSVLLQGPGAALTPAAVLAVTPAGGDPAQPAFHRVLLDRTVTYGEFDHDAPAVTVFGNLAEATQGKSEDDGVLGDGDAGALFQTFAIPKAPLTYLLDTAQVPSHLPQLEVWVAGVLWRRVPSLFAAGPLDRVYIVREDAEGKSFVQFGDGRTGARLPSGRGNVVARFRTGNGAHGPSKADAKPQADKRIAGFDAALLLEPVTGGAEPESAEGARVAAPGTMQSLGRIVSLADYEAEALAIPGVLKARAAWADVDGVPLVRVTILTASRDPADATAAIDALRAAVRGRGASRHPLVAVQGVRRQVSLKLVVGYDAARRSEDVRRAILEALGAAGEEGNGVAATRGLFSWQKRQFGEGLHGSHVVGAVQGAPGVRWVRLDSMRFTVPTLVAVSGLNVTVAPALLTARVPPVRRALPCGTDALLALDAVAVTLNLAEAREP